VIRMTKPQRGPALAREAEMAYATLAMVTDYGLLAPPKQPRLTVDLECSIKSPRQRRLANRSLAMDASGLLFKGRPSSSHTACAVA